MITFRKIGLTAGSSIALFCLVVNALGGDRANHCDIYREVKWTQFQNGSGSKRYHVEYHGEGCEKKIAEWPEFRRLVQNHLPLNEPQDQLKQESAPVTSVNANHQGIVYEWVYEVPVLTYNQKRFQNFVWMPKWYDPIDRELHFQCLDKRVSGCLNDVTLTEVFQFLSPLKMDSELALPKSGDPKLAKGLTETWTLLPVQEVRSAVVGASELHGFRVSRKTESLQTELSLAARDDVNQQLRLSAENQTQGMTQVKLPDEHLKFRESRTSLVFELPWISKKATDNQPGFSGAGSVFGLSHLNNQRISPRIVWRKFGFDLGWGSGTHSVPELGAGIKYSVWKVFLLNVASGVGFRVPLPFWVDAMSGMTFLEFGTSIDYSYAAFRDGRSVSFYGWTPEMPVFVELKTLGGLPSLIFGESLFSTVIRVEWRNTLVASSWRENQWQLRLGVGL